MALEQADASLGKQPCNALRHLDAAGYERQAQAQQSMSSLATRNANSQAKVVWKPTSPTADMRFIDFLCL